MNTKTLPGITFRVETPPQVTLPRMDVAAFVGLATSGPLDTPVAIEDVAQFVALFGPPPPLAWDAESGTAQTACLGPAVQDFFAQGGRRCWVVRVAGSSALANQFPLAGLLRVLPSGAFAPALARARSRGSWSDGLRAGAELLIDPLVLAGDEITPLETCNLTVSAPRGQGLQLGDMLQIDLDDSLTRGYLRVTATADVGTPFGRPRGRWQQLSGAAHWFKALDTSVAMSGEPGQVVALADESLAFTTALRIASKQLSLEFAINNTDEPLPDSVAETWLPGDWLVFTTADDTRYLLTVAQAGTHTVALHAGWQVLPPDHSQRKAVLASRVMLALDVRADDDTRAGLLSDLALCAPHPQFWADLPDDETMFRAAPGDNAPSSQSLLDRAAQPRFPLAGPGDYGGVYLPLGLEARPIAHRSPRPTPGMPLERDGLTPVGDPRTLSGADWSAFFEQIHLDPILRMAGQASLLAEALELHDVQGQPLRGIHSILLIDEISMLALPDLTQRGWRLIDRQRVRDRATPQPQPPADPCGGHELFRPIPAEPAPAPVIDAPPNITQLPVEPAVLWAQLPADEYLASGSQQVQLRAIELAAARADLVAMISVPAHMRAQAALEYRRDLGRALLNADARTASYAALYYPWLIERAADGELRRCGPEGALCGMIAAQSLARGAWIAPANQPLRRALAPTQRIEQADAIELYSAAVNSIAASVRGCVALSAQTLSDEPELTQLNVRRLLILLRRIALRDSQEHVFAPHSPAFRRRVKLSLERLLAALYARGAFAGNDPAAAYRVRIDETINTPTSIEAGRFVVELQVAPAQPLAFITVRLFETATGTLLVQEV